MNRVQCGCWGLTYPIGMFTVHDSVPLSLHLQEWSLVSHMAVWVEEGGEHDPRQLKDSRHHSMLVYSPEISSNTVLLAAIKGLWREVGRKQVHDCGGRWGGSKYTIVGGRWGGSKYTIVEGGGEEASTRLWREVGRKQVHDCGGRWGGSKYTIVEGGGEEASTRLWREVGRKQVHDCGGRWGGSKYMIALSTLQHNTSVPCSGSRCQHNIPFVHTPSDICLPFPSRGRSE